MGSDNLKLAFTYLIALVIVVGGGAILFFTRLDPPESGSQNLALIIAGFIGSAVTFVFSSETATRATRAAESATLSGSVAARSGPIQPDLDERGTDLQEPEPGP